MFKSIRDGFHLYLKNKKTDIDKKILNLDRGFINYCFLQLNSLHISSQSGNINCCQAQAFINIKANR